MNQHHYQSQQSLNLNKKFEKMNNFREFIENLHQLRDTNVEFKEYGKYFKFKCSDYMATSQILQYYNTHFQKRVIQKFKQKWHIKDKFLFFWIVAKYSQQKSLKIFRLEVTDWEKISAILELPYSFLIRKWVSLLKHTTINFHWTPKQQKVLAQYMKNQTYQFKWTELSIKIYQQTETKILRTCKDIRQRWNNYINPQLKKSKWTNQQNLKLFNLIGIYGKKWSYISKQLKFRTENQVKNHFKSILNNHPNLIKSLDNSKKQTQYHTQQNETKIPFLYDGLQKFQILNQCSDRQQGYTIPIQDQDNFDMIVHHLSEQSLI